MKIAILGSGVGAMTAAYWLTNPASDGTRPDHEITVYQLGWRAGGKGASGRNPDFGNRIEEHGLHMWMGFYANAFRMIRAVYEELGRALSDTPGVQQCLINALVERLGMAELSEDELRCVMGEFEASSASLSALLIMLAPRWLGQE